MTDLYNIIYNGAWEAKNIHLSANQKKNFINAGLIIVLGYIVSQEIQKK